MVMIIKTHVLNQQNYPKWYRWLRAYKSYELRVDL